MDEWMVGDVDDADGCKVTVVVAGRGDTGIEDGSCGAITVGFAYNPCPIEPAGG